MIYIGLTIYTIIVALLYKNKINTRLSCRVLIIIMAIPAILVSGLRYGIGVDYINIYEKNFYKIRDGVSLNINFEIGFTYLIKICSSITGEPWFMFFVMSIMTVTLYFVSLKENSKRFVLSIALFFVCGIYFDTFNTIRQYFAVAIFMYAIKYIKVKDLKRYLFAMVFAVTFHTSALFFIPFYWADKINLNTRMCMGILGIVFLLKDKILHLTMLLLSNFVKYRAYILTNTVEKNMVFSQSGFLIAIIALIPCIIVEKQMKKTIEGAFLFNMVLLGLIVSTCSGFLPFAERILYYSKSVNLLAIPYALSLLIHKKTRRYLGIVIVFLFTGMTIWGMMVKGWYAVLPYESIFSR